MILQLHSPIWLDTPKGEGICHFLIDPGLENDLIWVVLITTSREWWSFSNLDVRGVRNVTLGRDRDVTNLRRKIAAKAVRSLNVNGPRVPRRKKLSR